jgi:hypothetical protein
MLVMTTIDAIILTIIALPFAIGWAFLCDWFNPFKNLKWAIIAASDFQDYWEKHEQRRQRHPVSRSATSPSGVGNRLPPAAHRRLVAVLGFDHNVFYTVDWTFGRSSCHRRRDEPWSNIQQILWALHWSGFSRFRLARWFESFHVSAVV